jgi:hypothetical protein
MNKKQIKVGNVVELSVKPEHGTKTVQIAAIEGDKIEVKFGVFRDGTFSPRTYFKDQARKNPIRTITITAGEIASLIHEGEKTVADDLKKEANLKKEVAPLAKPSAAKKTATPTAAKKTNAADDLKNDRTAAAEKKAEKVKADKQKAAAKKAADKQAEQLNALAKEANLKPSEVAQQFTGGVLGEDGKYTGGRLQKFGYLEKEEAEAARKFMKDTIAANKKATALAASSALTDEEEAERKELEKSIKKNLSDFQRSGFEIGAALTLINQHRLYRSTHKTFKVYVMEVFDLSEPQAYSVMTAAKSFEMLSDGEKYDLKALPSIRTAETLTRGVDRFIADNGLSDDPESKAIATQVVRNVYDLALQNAPKDRAGKPIMNADHLNSVFQVVGEIAKTGAVEVDGKQVKIDVAKAAIGEMIADETNERAQRLNAAIGERIAKQKEAIANHPSQQTSAALDATLGKMAEEGTIPARTVPRLNTSCTVHGKLGIKETSDTSIVLDCGCCYIATAEGYLFSKNVKSNTTFEQITKNIEAAKAGAPSAAATDSAAAAV